MAFVRVARITALLAFCPLAGCAIGRFDPVPAQSVDLSGNWVLNHAASDNPQPLLEKLRPRPMRRPPGDLEDETQSAGPGGEGGATRRGGRGRGRGDQQPQVDQSYRAYNDSLVKVPVMQKLTADIARADQMTIHQSTDEFLLDYGSSSRTFTPGARSVVGADWGVADQSSGWKGKQYIIHVKPQQGVASMESFSLSEDGKHLIEQLRLGGGDYPAVELKRVYDRSDKPLSRQGPAND